MSRRALSRLVSVALLLGALAFPVGAYGATPKTTLSAVEDDVMCPSCHEPLYAAQSPQAQYERNFIRHLIDQGYDKSQIEQALVAQYGDGVLARPPAKGFNLTIYVLPAAILLVGGGLLAVVLPRWRRATRTRLAAPLPTDPKLSDSDASRLEEDLQRFDDG